MAVDDTGKNIGYTPIVQIRLSMDPAAPNKFHAELRMKIGGVWQRSSGYGADPDDAFEAALPTLCVRTGYPPTLLRGVFGKEYLEPEEPT